MKNLNLNLLKRGNDIAFEPNFETFLSVFEIDFNNEIINNHNFKNNILMKNLIIIIIFLENNPWISITSVKN